MNTPDMRRIKVLFSNLHNELLSDRANSDYEIEPLLHLLISELQYTPEFPLEQAEDSAERFLGSDMLEGYDILVLGAPTKDLDKKEDKAIRKFLNQGGGLLLFCNSDMLMDAQPCLEGLMVELGIELHEYHNKQPDTIDAFSPHALTAGVEQLNVSNIASLAPKAEEVNSVAYVEVTREPEVIRETIAACIDLQDRPNSGSGRIVVIGDVSLCSESSLAQKDNKRFILNSFEWLAHRNTLDIKNLMLTESLHLGESGQLGVVLQHDKTGQEPYVECILESEHGAIVETPLRGRTIQAQKPVSMAWQVTPQNLGKQGFQLIIRAEKYLYSRFKLLPDMHCLIHGHLQLETFDSQGKPTLTFETGEIFRVKGIFHPSSATQHNPLMKLECYEGLAYGEPFSPEPGVWNLKAVEAGTHQIALSIPATGHMVSAFVTVKLSEADRRTELYIAYVNPLAAKIVGRLGQEDKRLCHADVKNVGFEIALLGDYIDKLYADPSRTWLRKILTALKREKKRDKKLFNQLMAYFYPTYQPRYKEALIPYAPSLVSYLTRVYPAQRKLLEYNFLCSEETESINIKQNVASHLLLEKYGHGFFYTQTHLGRQLASLDRLGTPEKMEYRKLFELIRDSSIVVNEGFAAWLEITFLKRLTDPELRQAADQRHQFLILEASGFLQKPSYREFFRKFPPRYDSQYREGFECFDFIAKTYNIHCAVDAFMIATQINFGIPEDVSIGEFKFDEGRLEKFKAFFQKELCAEEDLLAWLSHLRLHQITKVLKNFRKKLELPVRRHYRLPNIAEDTRQLKTLISEDLKMRIL